MKKNFAKITVGIIMMLACGLSVSCDPAEAITNWPNSWYIKNETDSKLFYRFDDDYMQALSPGEIKFLYQKFLPYTGVKKDFNAFLKEKNYESFKIYLEMKGEPVKVWSKGEANSPGKQFWNEKSWTSEELTKPANSESATWIFEITPEDIK